jgi:hypothetical protein
VVGEPRHVSGFWEFAGGGAVLLQTGSSVQRWSAGKA